MKYSSFYIITLLFITIFSCQPTGDDEKNPFPPRKGAHWSSKETHVYVIKDDSIYIHFYLMFPDTLKTKQDTYSMKDFPRQKISEGTVKYLQQIPTKKLLSKEFHHELKIREELLKVVNSVLKKDEQASNLYLFRITHIPPSDSSLYYKP